MASNHTANFELNQWESSDPVLRADFNADNQKIDAALAAASNSVRLLDVTFTAANQTQFDIDVSGIDFTAYRCVKVYLENIATSHKSSIYIRLNNVSTGNAYWDGSASNQMHTLTYYGPHPTEAELTLYGRGPLVYSACMLAYYDSYYYCSKPQLQYAGTKAAITLPLQSINLCGGIYIANDNSRRNDTMVAGLRAIVVGYSL